MAGLTSETQRTFAASPPVSAGCHSAGVSFQRMWRELLPLGRTAGGGYRRSPFGSAERECFAWYAEQAAARGLDLEVDGQGNAVAWWRPDGVPDQDALLVGSHLDSVDEGGAFDGPLGVVSALAAVDRLRERGVIPRRRLGVAVFVEEEGSRFGVACLGSRLATGRLDAPAAAELVDSDGIALTDAMAAAGLEPDLGPSPLLREVGSFVELHVEQGRDLVHRDVAVGVGSQSWAHGRWRFTFEGQANHAGATAMTDRRDPMLTYAMTALSAAKQARLADARATFGRLQVQPNVTNAIPSQVLAWLDARAADPAAVDALVVGIERAAGERAERDGTSVAVVAESVSPTVWFDAPLAARLASLLGGVPVIPTGAGHDAGVLQAAGIASAMLYVRNPTGISHAPEESADQADCEAGVEALTDVLVELVR